MDEQVSKDLNKQIEDNYRGENPPNTKSQKDMTPDHRQELIIKMLDKSGYKLGIAPIPLDHIIRVENQLQKKGFFKREDTQNIRRQKTVK